MSRHVILLTERTDVASVTMPWGFFFTRREVVNMFSFALQNSISVTRLQTVNVLEDFISLDVCPPHSQWRFMTDDLLYVCWYELCSLPFVVQRGIFHIAETWTPAGRSRLDVWLHSSFGLCLIFFSPSGTFSCTTKSVVDRKKLSPHWVIRSLQRANGVCTCLILCLEP